MAYVAFDNRMLRRVCGPKMKEVAGGWRRLHNEELHNLCPSSNIRVINSRRKRWMGCVERTGKMENTYKILARKPEEKRPLGRPTHGWEDNIRMDLQEIEWESVD
jgi:hypothetical protein